MKFKTFFSEQARKPSGPFGRFIMPIIFDQGNAVLNKLMRDALELQESDRVLEIGFGTGKFLKETAELLNNGCIEGIDVSSTMVEMAKRRNRKFIAKGRVIIQQGDFEKSAYHDAGYDKVCSANTIYFWSNLDDCVRKIFRILKPGGKVILAFEDIAQLEARPLDTGIFYFYSLQDIENILRHNGFPEGIDILTEEIKSQKYHCAVATKKA